jgi:hypothetical protein
MKMIVESMMECRLAGETEVLGENLPQRHLQDLKTGIESNLRAVDPIGFEWQIVCTESNDAPVLTRKWRQSFRRRKISNCAEN